MKVEAMLAMAEPLEQLVEQVIQDLLNVVELLAADNKKLLEVSSTSTRGQEEVQDY
jgi:hypothetical protein